MPYNNDLKQGDAIKAQQSPVKSKKPVTQGHLIVMLLLIIFVAVVAFAQLFPETENAILKLFTISYFSDTAVTLNAAHA